ncbi:hypothetical protein Bcav_3832 [Beutenbergia cavernae DSM 12333]|uniref:Uncharacterized protein n=1 Tax=Beutenbergia cavernae (strain ATCC BAA-8 / DSM 12333 / CCUG 43141 / JCM 11478 / NBRC 16432 / NCIMB 13614 / HKI 0122) TaxID=471853 RepID=C5C4F0_BEUC1|nr:hypothetical protein [Beutenbergia cavernae]ACQ82074.1 hypothetical protein Bcav_3832 [Beutenbergia cavernae DSM 12333]
MHPVIQEVMDLIAEIERKIEELRTGINDMLESIPGFLDWIFDRVRDGWNWLVEKLDEFWGWVNDVVAMAGDPWGLSSAADTWNTGVGEPAMTQSREVDAGDLLVDDNWTGDAADQYKQKLPEQKSAMEVIRTEYAAKIATALDAVKSGIIKFWTSMAVAFGALVAGIIGAIASSATVFGLPAAPFIAGGAVLIAIIAVTVGVKLLESDCATANTQLTNAQSAGLARWPAFALA